LITVAIDSEHTRQTSAGTARASRSLVRALSERGDVRPLVIGGGPVLERGTLRKRVTTARQDFLWYPYLGRRKAANLGADVYHCPTPRAPITPGRPPLVVTVHDLVPVLFPETMTPWSRFYTRATLRKVLDAADIIVTPSADTANDLTRHLGVRQEKVSVVWNGVDPVFFSTPPDVRPVTEPYVLFVGTPEPRKNLPRLVEAMSILRGRGFERKLVIAGGGGWGNVMIEGSSAHVTGRVSDEQLLALYAHADCLALPSLHEGFGLPAVEAMAAGTPVVAGTKGALPEVVGSAGVLVDPYDAGAIAAGIERAISERSRLIKAGRKRAALFSWEKAAASMTAVYRSLL
jgi:glycosyltransferase involved in cell wall biosynthesis